MRLVVRVAVFACLAATCRGREERTLGPSTRISLQGGPESGEPERAGGASPVARGQGVYQQSCAPCHGPDGVGGTPMSRMMKVGNLADPAMHARLSDADMAALIRKGKGRMPAFAFDERTVRDVIAFVRTLKR